MDCSAETGAGVQGVSPCCTDREEKVSLQLEQSPDAQTAEESRIPSLYLQHYAALL